ncbi:MAG: hypothetical protein KC619_17130 [Myxococcales bacterium]|nr:hypothetical protein [Myxococcales bacterium]
MRDAVDVWVMGFAETDAATVAAVAERFGIDAATAEGLVRSTPRPVKRGIEPRAAMDYRRVLEELGARVEIVPEGEPPRRAFGRDDLPLPDLAGPIEPVAPASPPRVAGGVAVDQTPAPPKPAPPSSPAGPSLVVKAAIGAGLLAALGLMVWYGASFVEGLVSSADGAQDGGDVDSVCAAELSTRLGHADARGWLARPGHLMLGLSDPSAAIGLVNALYRGGATDVQVTQIEGNALSQYAGTLVAVLPEGSPDAVVRAAERGLGLNEGAIPIAPGARFEVGARYLRITFADLDAAEAGSTNPYQLERDLREMSRARERGFDPGQ